MVDMTHSPIFYFKSNPFNQAFLHLENIEKNIPLFFQKRHDEFLKTSNVFSKTSNFFAKHRLLKTRHHQKNIKY